MTPAERLSRTKRRKRPPRNAASANRQRTPVWSCRVRATREELNLSLADVAEAVGMSVTGLFQVEHGGDVMLTTATRLACFFGVAVEELWMERVE